MNEQDNFKLPSGIRINIDGHEILITEVVFKKRKKIDVTYCFVTPDRPEDTKEFDNHVKKVIEILLKEEIEKDK